MVYGKVRHDCTFPSSQFYATCLPSAQWASATVVIYVPATALPKVAILIHYLRIYPEKNFRIVVYTVLSVTVGYMIAICLVLIFRCHPLAKNWNPTLPGHCILLLPYVWNGILNVMTDLMVILVPVPRLVAWKVTLRRKLVISVMLATGSL